MKLEEQPEELFMQYFKYDGFSKAGESENEMMDSLPVVMKAMFVLADLDPTLASGYCVVFFMCFCCFKRTNRLNGRFFTGTTC